MEERQPAEENATHAKIYALEQAEAKLYASEERFRAIVEDQTEMICRFRPDFTITFVNRAFCEALQLPRQVLIGQDMLAYLMPDNQISLQNNLAKLSPENPVITDARSHLHR